MHGELNSSINGPFLREAVVVVAVVVAFVAVIVVVVAGDGGGGGGDVNDLLLFDLVSSIFSLQTRTRVCQLQHLFGAQFCPVLSPKYPQTLLIVQLYDFQE